MITKQNESSAEFLIELSKNPLFDQNIQKRLFSIGCALAYRPEINVTPGFRFKKGHSYLSVEGKMVLIAEEKNDNKGYETVLGDDGAHRYSRSNTDSDLGRVTGSSGDPRDLIPLEIDIPVRVPRTEITSDVESLCYDAEELVKELRPSSIIQAKRITAIENEVFLDVMIGGVPMNLQLRNGSVRKRGK